MKIPTLLLLAALPAALATGAALRTYGTNTLVEVPAAAPAAEIRRQSPPGVEITALDGEPIHTEEILLVKDRLASGRDRVAVDVFRPLTPGPHAAVVILHGTHGPGRAEKYYLRLDADLARHGYVGLFVRYYDRGRKGKGNRSQWAQTIGDTLSFAAALPGADPNRMALIGYSQGAFLALNDAPTDARIRAVVAFYGGLSPGFFPQAQEDMPPTLLFHGSADRIVPVRRSIETLKLLRASGHPADLVIYPGAVHGFNLNALPGPDAFAAEDSWTRTLAFLDFHLRYPAWTPAVLPIAVSPIGPPEPPSSGAFVQPPLTHLPVPYLVPSIPLDAGIRPPLIDPTLEQMSDLLRKAPPPRNRRHGSHYKRGTTQGNPKPRPAAVMP